MSVKALILKGDGINSEKETALAFENAGALAEFIHISDFLEAESFDDYDIMAFPGGFSYGDEIRSGKIMAELIKIHQKENLLRFINDKKPVIGICNGFQILMQLGLFDHEQKLISLEENICGKFINKWVELTIADSDNIWLRGIEETIQMPIRHKEGRIQFQEKVPEKVALRYNEDVNGSSELIAGLSGADGLVLGLMPHPEAALNSLLLPRTSEKENKPYIAQKLFTNAVNYSKERKGETYAH